MTRYIKALIILVFSIFILISCIPHYIQKVSLNEERPNSKNITIKNLLIVGAGSTATRLFLEKLSDDIKNELIKKGSKCEFIYVGKIPKATTLNLKDYTQKSYDGYLVINPIDTSFVVVNKLKFETYTPIENTGDIQIYHYGSQYKENLLLEFYELENNTDPIWSAELILDFDFAQPKKYKQLTKKILTSMAKNKLVFN